jgi:hypothetical protein
VSGESFEHVLSRHYFLLCLFILHKPYVKYISDSDL